MVIYCHQRTHSVLWSTLCCAVKSLYVKSTKCGLVPVTGMPHKRFFTLSKHSKQCNIKQNTADTWLYMHTGKYAMTPLLFEDMGELTCATAWIRKQIENKMLDSQAWPYCTWKAAPSGRMWLVTSPRLLAPLRVWSFIWGDSREVWKSCWATL